jgi:hypothetical protein
MNTQLRALALTAAVALTSAGRAQAQNTYQDFPFQQGSVFYRPSGAKPPKQVYRAPVNQYPVTMAPAASVARVPAARVPVTRYYQTPQGNYYTTAPRRRGLFGWWR